LLLCFESSRQPASRGGPVNLEVEALVCHPRFVCVLTVSMLVILLLPTSATAGPTPLDGPPHLVVRAGVVSAFDDDIDSTYGVIPTGELGVGWPIGGNTRLLLLTGYGTRSGDPYRDRDVFESDSVSRVRIVPFTLEMRVDLSGRGPVRAILGLAAQTAWIEERIPGWAGVESRDGQGYGLLISLGAEWRPSDERRALSLDVALGGLAGEVEHDPNHHDVDLRGVTVRLGYSLALGSREVTR
jgi:hypothetical protein